MGRAAGLGGRAVLREFAYTQARLTAGSLAAMYERVRTHFFED
jgi:hypothetical protein